ncbi:cryptochrome/photolyase family protein [Haloparvum alkalitolerans]|uniref:cryptochrome/photolyase family protein n=1 Tax=Haloparvum alkalitolerans TaxID=1042953 RepID=UPI003CEBCA4F
MTLLLLGDQLSHDLAALGEAEDVLMIESRAFAARKRYHAHKLTLVFSAMRHFRDELRERGRAVTYLRAEDFAEGFDRFAAEREDPDLRLMRPASHGAGERLRELAAERGIDLELLPNELFVTTPDDWRAWAGADADDPDATFRQEDWYRHVRRETGVLMEEDADAADGDPEPRPAGGAWNFDEENRETPPDDWAPPERATFEPDALTREVHDWVTAAFETWGASSIDDFAWPVTAAEAEAALERFVAERLPAFGDYQDAMVEGEPWLAHSLLSPAINLGLLDPMRAVRAAEDAYERGEAPINAVEGFVRQLLGWREFVRHVYRAAMPELADANRLDNHRDLPPAFWDGETEMTCLSEAVEHVRAFGYAHHIERLMVLSNFALLYGADPHELNEWFHLGFVDAYHWVTTPNVVAMGSFATDALSSKPYASSGNYVNEMSDYCASCPYAVSRTTGEGACPFNALYWDFLKENEETLRGTGRMGLMYNHVDDKDDEEWAAIRDRAREVRERAAAGEL